MEREVVGKGEGKGEGEMRKRGRGIVIGGMVLSLLLGCNNGIAELEKKNQFLSSLANLGNEFLNVFTSFGEIAGSALGFKTGPKKSDVRDYFDKVKKTVEGTKDKLEKIVENMEKEGNRNVSAVKTKVDELINTKLSKIIEGAKKASDAIGETGAELIGNIDSGNNGGAVGIGVDDLINGLKSIISVVLQADEGKPDAGDDKKAENISQQRGADAGQAGKLFGNAGVGSNDKEAAADAAKAVGAVTGADILQAIVKEGGDSVKLAKHNNTAGTITSGSNVAQHAKDGTIAGAITLRAIAKGGKFANGNTNASDAKKTVEGASVSAVTKALDTLTIAIRKTIDEGLKEVKKAMNINANANPVTSESGVAAK